MCTLVIGRDVVARSSVLLAANRDEDPARPSDPPTMLGERPRLVGGRDRRAGGTWLAIREARAALAILNRADRSGEPSPAAPGRRSRGLLLLDVAAVEEDRAPRRAIDGEGSPPGPGLAGASGGGLSQAALDRALEAIRETPIAPCTLVFAAPEACWLVAVTGDGVPRVAAVPGGWHVLTHADLDDPREPRTARLMRELEGFAPRSVEQAERRLGELLRAHGDPARDLPPVCLHAGRMVTVSSSCVWLAAGEARYLHAEGRPCEQPFADHSHLLRLPAPLQGRP